MRDFLSPSSLDEIRTQDPYQLHGFLQPLLGPGSSCAGISFFVINLLSYLCNPSAGFLFTLVGLSTDYLQLLFGYILTELLNQQRCYFV